MVKELGRYQKDTKMRKPGAMAALEKFTKTRIQFVATNVIVRGYNIAVTCLLTRHLLARSEVLSLGICSR